MSELSQLEALAERLYNSQDPQERAAAEAALKLAAPSAEALAQCSALLARSAAPFAQFLATSSLTRLLTEHWLAFTPEQHLQSKIDVLQFLFAQGTKTAGFVVQSALQLVARITKLGWFEEGQSAVVSDLGAFLDASPAHRVLGLLQYAALVQEMSVLQTGVRMSQSQHNRTAAKFRDSALLGVFTASLQALRECIDAGSASAASTELRVAAIKLAYQCLSFNFIGTLVDESGDDIGTVQVPAQWRHHFEDQEFIGLWFRLFATSQPPYASMALDCLAQIASVRRSLFSSETERVKFLVGLMKGIKEILDTRLGLNVQENHHALCRLLARLKSNYQLQQLSAAEGWQQWINTVFQFTIASLEGWRWSPNSAHYLMSFWSRMVTSLMYAPSTTGQPTIVHKLAPKVAETFIRTRLEIARAALDQPEDDPLGSDDAIAEELEFIPSMGRCDYSETSAFLLTLIDSMTTAISQPASAQQLVPGDRNSSFIFGQFAWMVYIIGAVIGGRMTVTSSDESDMIDGSLACRVFHLMRFTDSRLPTLPPAVRAQEDSAEAKLEFAFLSFLQSFRRMYIGDSAISASKAFSKMGELLGLGTHNAVLDVIITKITSNLKWWKDNPAVVDKTLSLFYDLTTGYCSGKLVARLDIVRQILQHHTDEAFAFPNTKRGNSQRKTLYTILGRLLFAEENKDGFVAFVKPLEATLEGLLALPTADALRQPEFREMAICICRKLEGIFASITASTSFATAFEWIYPAYTPLLQRLAEAFSDDMGVMKPLLELVGEMAHNKSNRIRFEYASANGLLLFKDVCSRVVVTYGPRLLVRPLLPQQDVYRDRYRGIVLVLDMLSYALGGEYVNFGVFGLYGDSCLADSLDVAFRLSLEIPAQEILAYAKLAKSFFTFLDVLSGAQPQVVCTADATVLAKVFSALDVGLKSPDTQINTLCCTTLDFIFTWYVTVRRGSRVPPAVQVFERNLAQQPEFIARVIADLLQILLFTDCQFLYTIARPLHVLLVSAPQHFESVKNSIVASQPAPSQRERLDESFAKLATETPLKLDPKSREKFTQSLVVFAHNAKTFVSPL